MSTYKLKDLITYLNNNKKHMSEWALKLLVDTETRLEDQCPISAKQYAKIVQEAKATFVKKRIFEFECELVGSASE